MMVIAPKELRPGQSVFKRFRKDGWPRCPHCNKDALESELARQKYAEDRIYLHILSGLICLNCEWQLLPGLKLTL